MKTMYKMINNKKGFTLIELIIVIAIIAILAAVAVPRLSGYTTTAKDNTDASNKKLLENVTAIAIADGKISVTAANQIISGTADAPTGAVVWTASGLSSYLNEWPVPKNGTAFYVTIEATTGKITVTKTAPTP